MRRSTRTLRRVATAALVSGAAAALSMAVVPSAQAGSSHLYRHGLVPTVEGAKNYALGLPIGLPIDTNLTYGGGVNGVGVTTGAPKVYLVFWGTQWGSAGTNAKGDTTLS